MKRTAIIREILTRMDEILPPGETISHPFESYIQSVLDEAYLIALKDYPLWMLTLTNAAPILYQSNPNSFPTNKTIGQIYIVGDNYTAYSTSFTKGEFVKCNNHNDNLAAWTKLSLYNATAKTLSLPVPENFVRIGRFKFTDWENQATKFISAEHPEYKYIENGTITPGVVKPVVVIKHSVISSYSSDPTRYLVCYGVTTVDEKPDLWYVKNDKDAGLESLSDEAIQGIVWKSCSLLMQIFKMPEVKIAEERYQAFILNHYNIP